MEAAPIMLAGVLTAYAIWTVWRLEPLHPGQLWAIPWAVSTTLYALHLLPYRGLSPLDAVLIGCASAAFLAGSVVLGSRVERSEASMEPHAYRTVASAAVLSLGLTVVGLVAFLVQAVNAYGFAGAIVSPAPLRRGIELARFTITIKYIYPAIATSALAGVAAGLAPSRSQRARWIGAGALAVLSVYFATGRGTIVDTALAGLCAFAFAKPARVERRHFVPAIIAMACATVAVFLVGGAVIGKTYANNSALRHVPSVFNDHPSISVLALPYEYASAPIAALGVQLSVATALGDAHGCAVLHPVCVALRSAGLAVPDVPRIRPFTSAPLPWNTYTALDVPIIDWGTVLVVPFLGCVGILLGWFARMAWRGDARWVLVYSVEAIALLTSTSSFNFLAPHVVGGILVGLAALWAGKKYTAVKVSTGSLPAPTVRDAHG